MTTLTFRKIVYGSPDYDAECRLRNTVLRQPLGLNLYQENLEAERNQTHFGLFNDTTELIACVIAVPQSKTTSKLRQMAVSNAHQGKGHGSKLLTLTEAQLHKIGIKEIHLHARSTAIPFYKKAGYQEDGDTFIEVSIPHIAMQKQI
ncbi:MAG: GNAT family N-acetyltransferase [Akkermansiaceae bacterium]